MDKNRLDFLRSIENFVPEMSSVHKTSGLLHRMFPEISRFNANSIRHLIETWDNSLPSGFIENEAQFELTRFIEESMIPQPGFLYLAYDFLDGNEIDVVNLDYFSKNFFFFWYPQADDLLIIADHFKWRILICHDGRIQLSFLSSKR